MNKWDLLFKKGVKYKSLNELYLDKLLSKLYEITNKKPKTVIDLGSGIGESTIKFLKHDFTVTGLDSSPVAITMARNLIKKENEKIKFSLLDLEKIPGTIKGNFDIVFCKHTYAFIKNKSKFLKNVNKLMHEDSIFVLITPVLYDHVQYRKEDKPGIAVNFNETNDLLQSNFNKVEIFYHDYFGERGDDVTFLAKKKR